MTSISQFVGLNGKTGKQIKAKDHLSQSIHDLLMTPIGTRVMRRDYGSALPDLLDQPMTAKTVMKMRASIVHAITKWESRVVVQNILVEAGNEHGVKLAVTYQTNDTVSQSDTIHLGGLYT